MAQGNRRRGSVRARRNGSGNRKGRRAARPLQPFNTTSRSLNLEQLEDRRLLATFVVNNLLDLDDDGEIVVGSLRQAIQLANADIFTDTIVFEDFITPGTIVLDGRENGGELLITNPVNILGPSADRLTIVGGELDFRSIRRLVLAERIRTNTGTRRPRPRSRPLKWLITDRWDGRHRRCQED